MRRCKWLVAIGALTLGCTDGGRAEPDLGDFDDSSSMEAGPRPQGKDAGPAWSVGSLPGFDAAVMHDGGPKDAALQPDRATPPDAAQSALTPTALLDHLRSCEIVGEGRHLEPPVRDGFDRCMLGCAVRASCTALRRVRCGEGRDSALESCFGACTSQPVEDGLPCDRARIRHAWACDGTPDCADGADERGCTAHVCANGESIHAPFPLCNGEADCADGSDEHGCAPYCASP